ncbi:hypothetical protein, partial [Burkholderia vietnamiensis]
MPGPPGRAAAARAAR